MSKAKIKMIPLFNKNTSKKRLREIAMMLKPHICNCFACGDNLMPLQFYDITAKDGTKARICNKCLATYKHDDEQKAKETMTDEQGNRLIKAVLFVASELEKHNKHMETIVENSDKLLEQLEEIDKSIMYVSTNIRKVLKEQYGID